MYCYAPTKEYLYRRIIIVGILWSLLFLGGLRSTMMDVWNFDLANYRDWLYVWNLWLDGWVVDETDEVIFFALIISLLPMWITGWSAISSIKWERIYLEFIAGYNKKIKDQKLLAKLEAVEKKGFEDSDEIDFKSLLTIERPRPIGGIIAIEVMPDPPLPFGQGKAQTKEQKRKDKADKKAMKVAAKKAQAEAIAEDAGIIEEETAAVSESDNDAEIVKLSSVKEILKTVGYELIENVEIANCAIDYVAISKASALLCLVDRDKGEWLADEESFGGEEPLWFSESKHRGSPIFKVRRARDTLIAQLEGQGIEVTAISIVKEGAIINGQDMLNTWLDMNVMVCRIGNGGPDELPSFGRVMKGNKAEPAKPETVEKIKKAIEDLTAGVAPVPVVAGDADGDSGASSNKEQAASDMMLPESYSEKDEKVEEAKEVSGTVTKPKKSSISLSKSKTVVKEEMLPEETKTEMTVMEAKTTDATEKVKKKEDGEEKTATPPPLPNGKKKKVVKRIVRKKKVSKPTALTSDKSEPPNEKSNKVSDAKNADKKTSSSKKKKPSISLKKK